MKEIRMMIFLVVIFTICSSLLALGRFAYIKASVVFNRRLYAEIMELYDLPFSEETIDEDFALNFNTVGSGGKTYYVSLSNSPKTVGFKAEGPGLWSTVEVFISIKVIEEKLYGMRVLSQGETPGLGARIAEREFLDRFSDLDINPSVQIVKFAMGSNEVDSISGATKTSTALEKIINIGIADYRQNSKYILSGSEE